MPLVAYQTQVRRKERQVIHWIEWPVSGRSFLGIIGRLGPTGAGPPTKTSCVKESKIKHLCTLARDATINPRADFQGMMAAHGD
jgi:hypothetical protein